MSTSPTVHILFWGTFLIIGALSNKISRRFNLPVMLMFLGLGLFLGSDNREGLTIANQNLRSFINFFGTVAMCFILYAGGFGTKFSSVRKVLLPGGVLAVFGVLFTALTLGGIFFGLSRCLNQRVTFVECLLFGSLISSTDASAVFSILRGKGIGLKGDLAPLLELESGSNDPMAAILTIFMLSLVQGKGEFSWMVLPWLFYALTVGVVIGILVGFLGQYLFRLKLEYDGLYFVFGVGLVLLSYGVADTMGANGFMAVYVCGMVMGNMRFYLQKGLNQFCDGISWLMQVALFLLLGFLVDTNNLFTRDNIIQGLVVAVSMMLLARPLAVFLCLCRSRFTTKEKVLISWVGLRGAAPIVLATYPLACEIEGAETSFHVVFCTVLTSVLIQGWTMMPLARLLKLDAPVEDLKRAPLELEIPQEDGKEQYEMYEFTVKDGNPLAGKEIRETRFPKGARIMLIRRDDHFLSPDGTTKLIPGDGLFIMGEASTIQQIADTTFPGSNYHHLKNSKQIRDSIRKARKRHFSRFAAFFRRGRK